MLRSVPVARRFCRTLTHSVGRASLPWVALLLLQSGPVQAQEIACEHMGVTAVGWSQPDAMEICRAVSRAMRFLRTVNVTLETELIIRPLSDASAREQPQLIAHFNARNGEMRIRPLAETAASCGEATQLFGLPMSRELWNSVIAHETAHAAVEPHFAPETPKIAASEYIATVTQLSALPETVRNAILVRYQEVPAWADTTEISLTYYLLDPCAFAVKSYRHFAALQAPSRSDFIRRLLLRGLRD